MKHLLKVEDRWLQRVRAHEKTAEVRYDDRDFQAGDTIEFLTADNGFYTGVERRITHVLRGVEGLDDGYVMLSLEDDRAVDALKRAEKAERANAPLRGTITRLTRELKEARS
ncbi:DUF3850 domain-containing protein [Tsukamurella sp. DT100]|uniref:DUF3850 domain-containing protein n=1 Tax=Tsukamurella sp. DT100 TaxID=3393415 RepID=UPI003CF43AD7